jgi:hypothetical protein
MLILNLDCRNFSFGIGSCLFLSHDRKVDFFEPKLFIWNYFYKQSIPAGRENWRRFFPALFILFIESQGMFSCTTKAAA